MDKLFFLCMAVALTTGSMAYAAYSPEWRGEPGSTYQLWEFGSDDLYIPVPDVNVNPYGASELRVTPATGHDWLDVYGDEHGIWPLSGEIDILIPNLDELRPEKRIWILLKWQPVDNCFLPTAPLVGISSPGFEGMSMEQTNMDIGTGWIYSIFDIVIWPNPFEEWITIKGDILVDQLVIDTICIPEPATICLLGLGTLILLKKRRA